jgi:hypothetical protein
LTSVGVGEFLEEMVGRKASPATCVEEFRYAWLRSILEYVSLSDVLIGGFVADKQYEAVTRFRDIDEEYVDTTALRIRRASAERATQIRDQFPRQAELVEHQANLRRRHMPVRDLFAEATDALLALKPCWAMSPLVVSQLLPPRTCFDVVIFDEASQITPADAVSSILRGKQLVVAGDQRQLPPTAFFVSETTSDEEGGEETEDDFRHPLIAGVVGFGRS